MKNSTLHQRTYLVLLAVAVILALLLLTGADSGQPIGRYRMAVITRNSFTDIFVIDTTTGIVKYLGKDEGKPFDAIKAK